MVAVESPADVRALDPLVDAAEVLGAEAEAVSYRPESEEVRYLRRREPTGKQVHECTERTEQGHLAPGAAVGDPVAEGGGPPGHR